MLIINWRGSIELDGTPVIVTVFVTQETSYSFSWEGSGTSAKPIALGQYDTDIGDIIVNHIAPGPNGIFFGFKGSGKPKGPLAKAVTL